MRPWLPAWMPMEAAYPSTPLNVMARTINKLEALRAANEARESVDGAANRV